MNLKLTVVLLFGLGFTGVQAQETVLAAGGNALLAGQGSVSYSVGQVVYCTNTGTTGSVSQGVQQPFEISVMTGFKEYAGIDLLISAYPNPTADNLILTFNNSKISDYAFQLFDFSGKLIESRELTCNQANIDFSNLDPAIYCLKVFENRKEIKVFKIIKNR